MKPLSQFSKEESAFIYQQIEELRPFLSDEGTVEVIHLKSTKNEVHLKIKLTDGPDFILSTKSSGSNLADAMMKGKQAMLKTLHEITNEVMSSAQRLEQINKVKNSTLH